MRNFFTLIGSPLSRASYGDYTLIEAPEPKTLSHFSLDSFIRPVPLFRRLLKSRHIPTALRDQDLEDLKQTNIFFNVLYESTKKGKLKSQIKAYKELDVCYIQALTAEIISKVLSYRENIKGQSINLPTKFDNDWKLVSYNLDFIDFGERLPLLILQSNEPNTSIWISPRGTSPYFGIRSGSFESLFLDFSDKEGVNLSPVTKCKDKIRKVMDQDKSVILTGHSLGGLLALKIALDQADLSPTTYTFCSPGIDKTNKFHYDELKQKPKVIQFLTEGDLIPSSGKYFLGRVFAIHIKNYTNNLLITPFSNHIRLSLNKTHTIHKVDIGLEEQTLSRKFMERYIRGGLFRNLIKPLKKFLK